MQTKNTVRYFKNCLKQQLHLIFPYSVKRSNNVHRNANSTMKFSSQTPK